MARSAGEKPKRARVAFAHIELADAHFVDGGPYDGDPAEIALEDLRRIAIVIGSFPDEVPSTYDFSAA